MAVITNSGFIDVFLAVALVLYLLYRWFNNNNDYWSKRGVATCKNASTINSILGIKSYFESVGDLYKYIGNERYCGTFQFKKPLLLVRDPELINKIMVKDFNHFQDRALPKTKDNTMSLSLFGLRGLTWKTLRYKLIPTFSTGKLKGMFEQVSKCGDNMMEKINNLSEDTVEFETKTFIFEFTLDVISSCAFGLQFKPGSPQFNEFKTLVQNIFKGSPLLFFRFGMLTLLPKLAEKLNITPFSSKIDEYFLNLVKATMKYRKDNNIQRNDYFQLLLTLKEQEESGKDMGLTSVDITEEDAVVNQMQYTERVGDPSPTLDKLFSDKVICANSFIFLLGGSETVSSTISMVLFELSRHPDVQQKLQQEVDSVLAKHGSWSYETIKDMTYMDQIVQESQRLYPVIALITRECLQDYKVHESDLVLEKGVLVGIPVAGIHRSPEFYPDPEAFKPERFKDNNFKPNPSYLPFGDGPRICIAMRFAVMEVKTCIARIMSLYSVKLSPKMCPLLEYEPRSVVPAIKGGLWLRFEKRDSPLDLKSEIKRESERSERKSAK